MFSLWYLWTLYNGRYKRIYDEELFQWIDESTDKLEEPQYQSLLKMSLAKTKNARLKERQTVNGVTLKDIIYSGVENPACGIGVYAADPDSYYVFKELFDPIIELYHSGFKYFHKTPMQNYGNLDKIFDLDPTGHYISSIRIRSNRSLNEYLFVPKMAKCELLEVEEMVAKVLLDLGGDLSGYYYSLSKITEEVMCMLKFHKFLFQNNNKILRDANVYNSWPDGRGVFFNHNHTLLVWINEEDHIRLVSMQQGGNLRSVYERYIKIMGLLSEKLSFAYDERLGYLNFSIMNLGIALRISLQITLPCLSSCPDAAEKFQEFFKSKNLGHKAVEDMEDTYEVFTRKTLGLTEFQCVEEFQRAIFELILLEHTCSGKGDELPRKPCTKPSKEATPRSSKVTPRSSKVTPHSSKVTPRSSKEATRSSSKMTSFSSKETPYSSKETPL